MCHDYGGSGSFYIVFSLNLKMMTMTVFAAFCAKQACSLSSGEYVGWDVSVAPKCFIYSGMLLWRILPLSKKMQFLWFGYCTWPYFDFDHISIISSALFARLSCSNFEWRELVFVRQKWGNANTSTTSANMLKKWRIRLTADYWYNSHMMRCEHCRACLQKDVCKINE